MHGLRLRRQKSVALKWKAEARQAHDEITIRRDRRETREVDKVLAVHDFADEPTTEPLHAQIGKREVESREIHHLLAPLHLEVLSRRDDQHTKIRIEMAKERHHAEGDECLPHSNFISEIRNAVAFQHVVQRHRTFKLLHRLSRCNRLFKVQKVCRECEVNHEDA